MCVCVHFVCACILCVCALCVCAFCVCVHFVCVQIVCVCVCVRACIFFSSKTSLDHPPSTIKTGGLYIFCLALKERMSSIDGKYRKFQPVIMKNILVI